MALTDNLVAYWTLDESSGTRNDSVGSNHLTDNNTVGSAAGKLGSAADFEAGNLEWLSRADNADLSTGDIDFTLAVWVRLESKPAVAAQIVSKGGATSGEYFLGYSGSDDRLAFQVFASSGYGGQGRVAANNLGSPSTGTWYFVVAWHDAVNNQIGIAVNGGTADTASHSGGVFNGTDEFALSINGTFNTQVMDGLIDEVGFWKRVLTSGERTQLYNGGAGLTYPFSAGATGSAALTQAGNAASGAGVVAVAGSAGPTQAANALSAAGTVATAGAAAVTQAAQTLSAAGTAAVAGAAAPTQAGDALAAAGAAAVAGALSATQAGDALSADGTAAGGVTGSASPTQDDQSAVAAGTAARTGAAAVTQAGHAAAAAGTVAVAGTLAATQAPQSAAAAGTVAVAGAAAVTQAGDALAAAGTVAAGLVGSADLTQAAQSASAAGTVAVTGAAAVTQAAQASAGSGAVAVVGSATLTQAGDALAAAGTGPGVIVPVRVSLVGTDTRRVSLAGTRADRVELIGTLGA